MGVGGTATNDKGEYRIDNLAPGRYHVFAHCRVALPAAHPLLPRGDPRTPHETYLPQFYGGGLDPATATRLTVRKLFGSVVACKPKFPFSGRAFVVGKPEVQFVVFFVVPAQANLV